MTPKEFDVEVEKILKMQPMIGATEGDEIKWKTKMIMELASPPQSTCTCAIQEYCAIHKPLPQKGEHKFFGIPIRIDETLEPGQRYLINDEYCKALPQKDKVDECICPSPQPNPHNTSKCFICDKILLVNWMKGVGGGLPEKPRITKEFAEKLIQMIREA